MAQFAVVEVNKDYNFPCLFIAVPVQYLKCSGTIVKYMEPPYTKDDEECIKSFVEKSVYPPPDNWKEFRCTVKNFTTSYSQAQAFVNLYKRSELPLQNPAFLKSSNHTQSVGNPKKISSIQKRTTETKLLTDNLSDILQVPKLNETIQSVQEMSDDLNDAQEQVQSPLFSDVILEPLKKKAKVDNPPECGDDLATRDDLNRMQEKILNTITNFSKKVCNKLNALDSSMKELCAILKDKKNHLEAENIIPFHQIVEQYNSYKFPLTSFQEFNDFNGDIEKNIRNIKDTLKKHILSTINISTDLRDSLTRITKNFLSKDVLLTYTAQRQISGSTKPVFINTIFYKTVQDSIIQAYKLEKKDIEEKQIMQALSSVFNNAKDWGGKRRSKEN